MYEQFSQCSSSCTFPCRKSKYTTQLSFGRLSVDPHIITNDKLQDVFVSAKDTFQNTDYSTRTQKHWFLPTLASEIVYYKSALHQIDYELTEFRRISADIAHLLTDKMWFYQEWGLEKILQLASDRFLRGWSQYNEEYLKHVTTYFDTLINFISEQLLMFSRGEFDDIYNFKCILTIHAVKDYIKVAHDATIAIQKIHESFQLGLPLANMSMTPLSFFDDAYLTEHFVQDVLQYDKHNKTFEDFAIALDNFTSVLYMISHELEPLCKMDIVNTSLLQSHLQDYRTYAIALIRAKYTYFHDAIELGRRNAEKLVNDFNTFKSKWIGEYKALQLLLEDIFTMNQEMLRLLLGQLDSLYTDLNNFIRTDNSSLFSLCEVITSNSMQNTISSLRKQQSVLNSYLLDLGKYWSSLHSESDSILKLIGNDIFLQGFYQQIYSNLLLQHSLRMDNATGRPIFCNVLVDMLKELPSGRYQKCDDIMDNITHITFIISSQLGTMKDLMALVGGSAADTIAHIDDIIAGNMTMMFQAVELTIEHCEQYIDSIQINAEFVRYVGQ